MPAVSSHRGIPSCVVAYSWGRCRSQGSGSSRRSAQISRQANECRLVRATRSRDRFCYCPTIGGFGTIVDTDGDALTKCIGRNCAVNFVRHPAAELTVPRLDYVPGMAMTTRCKNTRDGDDLDPCRSAV